MRLRWTPAQPPFCSERLARTCPAIYGGPCNEALLATLGSVDPDGTTTTLILRGDLLLENLASKVKSVTRSENRSAALHGYDQSLLATVLHDFAVGLSRGWHTFPDNLVIETIGRHSIHCLVLPTLATDLRQKIDQGLRAVPFYMGATEIDLGNPIQITGFFRYLVKDAAIHNGAIYLEEDWEGSVNAVFEGEEHMPNGLRVVPEGGLIRRFGPLPSAEISEGGQDAIRRFEAKRTFTLQERVLAALSLWWDNPSNTDFAFEAVAGTPFDATVPPPKLADFLLNPDHRDNKGRAKFFAEVLGIQRDDWRYLAAQVQDGLDSADLHQLVIKRWNGGTGASFNLPVTIIGRNGRSALVTTNWIMRPGEVPSLSTVVPGTEMASDEGPLGAVLPPELSGDAKWSALHALASLAGEKAAAEEVPTPMVVGGYGAYAEGLCGWAEVHVPDARRDFARWLLRNGPAHRGTRTGATLHFTGPSQSVDRAYAAASAYARVLTHNGVVCKATKHLD